MESANDKNEESRKKKMAAFVQKQAEARKRVEPGLMKFIVSLAVEGERSAVVLGAERINVSLEALLQSFLRPSLQKEDELFEANGALGTFSRKIEMAYRIGLIDLGFKRALDLVRRLRNDFAHATEVETLEDHKHSQRVKALRELMAKEREGTIEAMSWEFQKANPQSKTYLSCVMILLLKLELVRYHMERPEIFVPAKVNYQDPD